LWYFFSQARYRLKEVTMSRIRLTAIALVSTATAVVLCAPSAFALPSIVDVGELQQPSLALESICHTETQAGVVTEDTCGPLNAAMASQFPVGGETFDVNGALYVSSEVKIGDGNACLYLPGSATLSRLNLDSLTTTPLLRIPSFCYLGQSSTNHTIKKVVGDFVNGQLLIWVDSGGGNGAFNRLRNEVVRMTGLPRLLDFLVSFIPGQQALNILTPVHPDGFETADAIQVWTGDVRSMPDWSRAEPLACAAATNPVSGQAVTVQDTLPDPAPGQGRYYLVASQNGSNRRLGRQYLNGAFSARDPTALPTCTP
jgi:hypothetical protein